MLEMLRAGASGYLVKGTRPADLVEAVLQCVRGQSALSAEVTADLLLRRRAVAAARPAVPAPAPSQALHRSFTAG